MPTTTVCTGDPWCPAPIHRPRCDGAMRYQRVIDWDTVDRSLPEHPTRQPIDWSRVTDRDVPEPDRAYATPAERDNGADAAADRYEAALWGAA